MTINSTRVRLVQARNLSIEEAVLTGESEPSEKETAPAPKAAALADRNCMAYSGTLVAMVVAQP